MRKILVVILSIIQLAVAIFMIGFGQSVEKDVQEYGKEYKIKINIASVMDGKVIFSPEEYDLWMPLHYNQYAVLDVDENGNAYCKEKTDKKPDTTDYISPTKRNQNRLYEYKVDYDKDISSYKIGLYQRDAHITAKVYNGNIEVTNLYIEDLLVADWIEKFEAGEIPEIDSKPIIGDSEIVWEDKWLKGGREYLSP